MIFWRTWRGISADLDFRLQKLRALVVSADILQENLGDFERFDPAEVRRQLIFLRGQNLLASYPDRILESRGGAIEAIVEAQQWKQLLLQIAAADPESSRAGPGEKCLLAVHRSR